MSGPTKIEWADSSWNPISGCSKVSAGCQHCYAERMVERFGGRIHGFHYGAHEPGPPYPFSKVITHPERLAEPLHWRKPRKVFVCSMSDLFHPDVPDEFIDRVFAVTALASQHTFMVLTKRPEGMAKYVSEIVGDSQRFTKWAARGAPLAREWGSASDVPPRWPLPNVWLGVSVEDQATADERIPYLLRCPAAVRFLSYEPALGPVDLSLWLGSENIAAPYERGEGIDWVIAGGESGPKARPAHPDWFRSVRDQCQDAGVPFFFKQKGEWSWDRIGFPRIAQVAPDGWWQEGYGYAGFGRDHHGAVQVCWVGKKAAGRLLDGRDWNEFPEARG